MLHHVLHAVIILCITATLLYWFALKYDPCRPHARLLRQGVWGLALLTLWNLLPLPPLGVNPLSVMITGALGLPGIGLIAVMNLLP